MEIKRLASIAACVFVLVTAGCQDAVKPVPPTAPPSTSTVRSVAVDPLLGVYNYAHVGDTLQFTALNPNSAPFWVVFEAPSPCKEAYVKVTKDTPGQCVVTAPLNPYYYYFSLTEPTSSTPIPPPPPSPPQKGHKPVSPKPTVGPHSCPQCQIMLTSPSTGSPLDSGTSSTNSSANAVAVAASGSIGASNAQPAPVSCKGGTATVAPIELPQGQSVFWYDPDGSSLTVTVPSGVCSDANGKPQTTFSQYQPCVLTGKPQTTSYDVTIQGCTKAGTGSLKIDAP